MKKREGFILVEIALAIAFVGAALGSMVQMFSVAAKSAKRQRNISVALNLAQERMEEIKNLAAQGAAIEGGAGSNNDDFWGLPNMQNVCLKDYATTGPAIFLTESDTYAVQGVPGSLSTFTDGSPYMQSDDTRVDRITQIQAVAGNNPEGSSGIDFFRVTVTVFWKEGSKVTSVPLTTYIN